MDSIIVTLACVPRLEAMAFTVSPAFSGCVSGVCMIITLPICQRVDPIGRRSPA